MGINEELLRLIVHSKLKMIRPKKSIKVFFLNIHYFILYFKTHPWVDGGQSARYRAVGGGGLHISDQTRSHHTQHHQEASTLHLDRKGLPFF
jgi:hypothetical protein